MYYLYTMKEIKLLKHDSCYTYVLRRSGKETLELLTSESNDTIEKLGYSKKKKLQKGDILVYINPDDKSLHAGIIDLKCRIFQKYTNQNLHFMVYEGNGIVSDLTIMSDSLSNDILKSIRLRKLKDLNQDYFVLNL